MKTKLLAVSMMFVSVMVGSATAADEWKEFKPDKGGFSVLLSEAPMELTSDILTLAGKLSAHFCLEGDSNGAYAVAYCDYPEKAFTDNTVDKLLDDARDVTASKAKAKPRSEKKIEINGNPGREFIIDNEKGEAVHFRFYFVKTRHYQLIAGAPKAHEADVSKMLDSFKLLDK